MFQLHTMYVTRHKCADGLKKNFDLRSGSQHNRQIVRFFNVPVEAQARDHPFYGYSENRPILVAIYDAQAFQRPTSWESQWDWLFYVICNGITVINETAPREDPGVKSRMWPSYPQCVVKGD